MRVYHQMLTDALIDVCRAKIDKDVIKIDMKIDVQNEVGLLTFLAMVK